MLWDQALETLLQNFQMVSSGTSTTILAIIWYRIAAAERKLNDLGEKFIQHLERKEKE